MRKKCQCHSLYGVWTPTLGKTSHKLRQLCIPPVEKSVLQGMWFSATNCRHFSSGQSQSGGAGKWGHQINFARRRHLRRKSYEIQCLKPDLDLNLTFFLFVTLSRLLTSSHFSLRERVFLIKVSQICVILNTVICFYSTLNWYFIKTQQEDKSFPGF